MNEFKLKELKHITDVLTGFPFKSKFYGEKGIKTVRGENVTEGKLRWDTVKCWNEPFEKKDYYSLKANDIVIGMDGSKVGKNKARIFKHDLPLLLAQRVACVRAKKELDQVFLYYCINNIRFEDYVYRIQTGSSVPHISKTQIESFQIPFPVLTTQKKIAKVLSDLDAKIEVNNKINAELEAMAKTIYDYWFVQFDFPNKNGKPYKSSGGKMVFNEGLKREIPEGWEVSIIGDLLAKEQLGGKTLSSNYLDSGSIPIIDQSTKFICGYTNDESKRIKAKVPRVVFGDHTRIVKLINFDFARGADGTQVLLSKEERVPQYFLYHSLLNIDLSNYGYARHFKFLKDRKNIIPKLDIVNEFEAKAKVWYDMIWSNMKQNQQLSELRDWLLPMLMNGQVTVNNDE